MKYRAIRNTMFVVGVFLLNVLAVLAKDSKVRIHVRPEQASIFVDGVLFDDSSRNITLMPGKHTIAVYNYGYTPQVREITLEPGRNPGIEFSLAAIPGTIAGPWGRIQIEGASHDAILLNGKTPEFLVGHGDEFNNGGEVFACCAQQLIVSVGTHQVTVLGHGKEIWSGQVTVGANQRVIVHVPSGKQKIKAWPEGASLASAERFKAGIATAAVAVAPVSGKLIAQSSQINCGDSTQLSWSTSETVQRTMVAESESRNHLEPSGELTVDPEATTTYSLQAAGPGGSVNQSVTVNVNTAVQSSLQASPTELHYRRIGDKIVAQDLANLSWTTSNASAVSIDPLGSVKTSDSLALKLPLKQDSNGPIDEVHTYTLTAKNECGGSSTQTATVHITGAIEAIPELPLTSVFFPTGFPEQRHPEQGLVKSQEAVLTRIASAFKSYLEYDQDAYLTIVGHADERDSNARNKPLSERRANRVKQYLLSLGVPDSKIAVVAQGDEKQLDASTVKQLRSENPSKAPESLGSFQDLFWAYNRRVDIVLLPNEVVSKQYFPGDAEDANILADSNRRHRKDIVVMASEKERVPADAAPVSNHK